MPQVNEFSWFNSCVLIWVILGLTMMNFNFYFFSKSTLLKTNVSSLKFNFFIL